MGRHERSCKRRGEKRELQDLRELKKIEEERNEKEKGPFEQSLDNVINKPKKITTHEIPITEQSIKQLSQDINAYVNRKEKRKKPVVVKRPVIKQPK